ncbi:hypothetical protein [Massilia horti]|uniref:Lipoprotein n=1 Tax=Massilia horti TaxID=2562153 RepID=A0A4Y9T046_9BURK|nr:hypothetical protein [Massilia horti]TFW32654.1 hypothetical protein E4O92_09255 [Massilia horti]
MMQILRAVALLPVLLVAACANQAPPPRGVPAHVSNPDIAPPATPAPTPLANVKPQPVVPLPVVDELKRQQAQQKKDADDEAQRLAPYQKNLFQVFRLSETLAGFKPKAKAVGVYELAASKTGKLRLALAQLPNSPARLASGSYVVSLDLAIDYTEKQECIASACAGKSEQFERTTNHSVQLALNPKNNFSATATLPLVDVKTTSASPNYRSSYSNLVLTVRRMTASVAKVQE